MTTRVMNSQKAGDLYDPADCTVFSDIAGDFRLVILKPLIVLCLRKNLLNIPDKRTQSVIKSILNSD